MEHIPVLLDEAIELLNIKSDGTYIDGTFGRGGHSKKILEKLDKNGRLIAFDKDPEAIKYAQANLIDDRFIIIHDSFVNMDMAINSILASKSRAIDGILLDLGVSSPQLDQEDRGFSFRFDSELDMRMDNSKGITARQWINKVDEQDISDVLWRYGEERFAKKIAKAIAKVRESTEIVTTKQLANIIAGVVGYQDKSGQHPATRSFQAIRIVINNELEDLEKSLDKAVELLKVGGRLVVISFHSLEDRIVKMKFNQLSRGEKDKIPKWVMITDDDIPSYKVVAKKVKAGITETKANIRSRSAIMRALVKIK